MAVIAWKFINLNFGQAAWLEGKVLLSYGQCLGSVLDVTQKKVVGLLFSPPWDF